MIDLDHDYRMLIGGRLVGSTQTLPAFNPATRAEIARVPDATKEQLDEAVAAAAQAFRSWGRTSWEQRAAVLEKMASALEANADGLCRLLIREQGKPLAGAQVEVFGGAAWLRETAKQRLHDEVVEDSAERRVVTRFSPLGVVGGIVPWNFPVMLAMWKIAPALMA
ncbi:MAG: aldehyde dehydrogenase family protein, partial [Gammaproteobacteria bacterium]